MNTSNNTATNANTVSLFKFNAQDIRVVTLDGAPWFVAKDVCAVLGLAPFKGAFGHHLTGLTDGLDVAPILKLGVKLPGKGQHSARVVSESGLYKLVMKSRKPEAVEFKHWVAEVVLPAIEKDGGYVLGEEKVASGELSEDEFIFKAMSMLQAKAERLTAERDEARLPA